MANHGPSIIVSMACILSNALKYKITNKGLRIYAGTDDIERKTAMALLLHFNSNTHTHTWTRTLNGDDTFKQ